MIYLIHLDNLSIIFNCRSERTAIRNWYGLLLGQEIRHGTDSDEFFD